MLKYNNFKIGFIDDFHYECGNYAGDDHFIFAYDMETHIVITADTWDSGKCFNSVNIYCPGMDYYNLRNKQLILLSNYGSGVLSCFTPIYKDIYDKNLGVIHYLKNEMKSIIRNKENFYLNDSINLWNYSDENIKSEKDFDTYRKRIKRADREDMLELFQKSKIMLEALNS